MHLTNHITPQALHSAIASASSDLSSSSPASSSSAANSPNSNLALTSENTFLKLLVAQIKNQDPLNPTDPTQFVGQLTQYSELEQLIQINAGITTIKGASATSGGGATPGPTSNGTQTPPSNSTGSPA